MSLKNCFLFPVAIHNCQFAFCGFNGKINNIIYIYRWTRLLNKQFLGTVTGTGRWKVSAKIQQLLNTLKRPKRRPLPEFYEDDDIELEIAANPKDPNAPKPEGATMTPAIGDQLVVS